MSFSSFSGAIGFSVRPHALRRATGFDPLENFRQTPSLNMTHLDWGQKRPFRLEAIKVALEMARSLASVFVSISSPEVSGIFPINSATRRSAAVTFSAGFRSMLVFFGDDGPDSVSP